MKKHDPFYDEWEKEFDKNMKRGFAVFAGIIVVNLIFWAVVIWAIVKVVNHYT